MKIRHFLYNAFLIEADATKIAIDPGQNLWLFKLTSLIPESEWESITHICVTHGDPDHYWQCDRVAAAAGAPVFCGKDLARVVDGEIQLVAPRGRELSSWIGMKEVYPLEVGDVIDLGAVQIEAIRSKHGPIEIPILGFKLKQKPGPGVRVGLGSTGFKITVAGKTIVNLGDSLLLPEWRGLRPDILMLPIGGLGNNVWTMDVKDAVEAVRLISPGLVIPCHYNVPFFWHKKFAPADDHWFKTEVEKLGVDCRLMERGDAIDL